MALTEFLKSARNPNPTVHFVLLPDYKSVQQAHSFEIKALPDRSRVDVPNATWNTPTAMKKLFTILVVAFVVQFFPSEVQASENPAIAPAAAHRSQIRHRIRRHRRFQFRHRHFRHHKKRIVKH
jgi:hypothetical protein